MTRGAALAIVAGVLLAVTSLTVLLFWLALHFLRGGR